MTENENVADDCGLEDLLSTPPPKRKKANRAVVVNPPTKTRADNQSWPRRDVDRLYCPTETHQCAVGALEPLDDETVDGGVDISNTGNNGNIGKVKDERASSRARKRPVPCVTCAYKICNFDICMDRLFTKEVPNVRPELCPRNARRSTVKSSSSSGNDEGGAHDLDGTMGYRRGMSVLAVGDGDLTFSVAVSRLVIGSGSEVDDGDRSNENGGGSKSGFVAATSYENRETLLRIYPDFAETEASLKSYGETNVQIGYKVDATRLAETLPGGTSTTAGDVEPPADAGGVRTNAKKFHRISWNFPCTAISNGQDGQNDAMEQNKELVRKFLTSAAPLLDDDCGEIHMAHKTKPPFNQWHLEEVALEGPAKGLEFKGRIAFDKSVLPPYTPRKALDRKSFPCHDACVYVFGRKRGVEGAASSPALYPPTIPEKDEGVADDDAAPPTVLEVTTIMLKTVRTIHLMYADAQTDRREHGGSRFEKRVLDQSPNDRPFARKKKKQSKKRKAGKNH